MEQWQDLLSYVTCPEVDPEVEGSKQKLKGQKRKFDQARQEKKDFEEEGGASSSTARLDIDEDAKFKYGDQYVGINDVVHEGGNKCLLFNWASTTQKKTENQIKKHHLLIRVFSPRSLRKNMLRI
mgnify:CR=1 FL=1